MASPAAEAVSGDLGKDSPTPVAHHCAACKRPMLNDNGTPRDIKFIGHRCDFHDCKLPLHAPMTCDHVWFPTVSSNGREFCCKEHLLTYNASEDTPPCAKVEVRRREDQPDEIPGDQPAPHAGEELEAGTNETPSDKGTSETPKLSDGKPAPPPLPSNSADEGKGDKPPVPDPMHKPLTVLDFTVGTRIQMNFKPLGSSWYGGVVGHVIRTAIYFGLDDGELRSFELEEAAGLEEAGLL
eukprot:6211051-Pleurochrysis_carterae.AAC.1